MVGLYDFILKQKYYVEKLAKFILKYALFLFILIIAITAFMGWQATKITLDYDFTKAIPNNNIKYIDYKKFNDKFGEEGDIMVVGFEKKICLPFHL